jgi:hypothetical protein
MGGLVPLFLSSLVTYGRSSASGTKARVAPSEKDTDVSLALSQDFRLLGNQGDNGGRIGIEITPINNEIELSPEQFINIQRAAYPPILILCGYSAGIEHRIAQCCNHGQTDHIGWYPDANGLLPGHHDFGYKLGAGEHKGVRAGKVLAHEAIGAVTDMAVDTDIGQRRAHEAEGLILGSSFHLEDLLDGLLVKNITTNAVHGIGGIPNNASPLQGLGDLGDQAGLRIDRVDFEYSCHRFAHQ